MKLIKKLTKPETFLRLGLGVMFLYSGYSMYATPDAWIAYTSTLPEWILTLKTQWMTLEQLIVGRGIFEMIFGVVLLLWFLPLWLTRIVSILIAIQIISLLVLAGTDVSTFRDIGVAGAALALVAVLYRKS